MKKILAGAVAVMFLLLPFSLVSGMSYYNLSIMDTAQMQKSGSFMLTASDDVAIQTDDSSIFTNLVNGRLSYVIVEGLEAALAYNHSLIFSGLPVYSNPVTGSLNLRYALGLGDIIRFSVGAGFGFPLSDKTFGFMFSGFAEPQFIPELCVSAKLGSIGLHLMLKDMMNFFPNEMINWVNIKGSVAFQPDDSLVVALTGGTDSYDTEMFITGGLEMNWNMAGPLQLGLGVFGSMLNDTLFIRGLVKVGIVL